MKLFAKGQWPGEIEALAVNYYTAFRDRPEVLTATNKR